MEQKTEASQAVDGAVVYSLLPCPFCNASLEPFGLRQHNHPRNGCWLASVKVEWSEYALWNARAAIKAQQAPTEAQHDRQALQAEGTHPAPCARHCEATAFGIEIRRLEAENAQLRAAKGEDSARLDADMLALLIREAGILNARGMAWLLNGESISLNLTNLLAIANMIEDGASAETGGVKL